MTQSKSHRARPGEPEPAGVVALHALGRLELVAADGTILLGPGKPLAVLAYLRSQSTPSATRAHLADLLWSDLEPDRARANLRQTLLVLRRVLPDGTLVSEGDVIALHGMLPFDRDQFIAAADRGDLEAAIGHYRGDFIPDMAVPGGAEFEMWCDIERRHLGALFARVLESAARAELTAGQSAPALLHARRMRDLDPSRERAWRLVIEATIAGEGLASARLEVERLAEMLRGDGRPPEPATTQLFQRVRDVGRSARAREGAVAAPEFVGRETQLARGLAAWATVRRGKSRHVHVEALAGTGKTRLLEETCLRLQATGGRVVRCGARRDEREVPFALAATIVTALARLPGSISVAPSSMSALVAVAPDASAVFEATADASVGEEAMRRRVVALADLLGAVAHEMPLALALDDTHWADAASLRLVSLALGRLSADTRLLLLTAGREALPGDVHAEHISLPPLTVAQVDAMLQSIAGAGAASWWGTFVAALRDAAGGVPFHVLQLLHAVVEKHLLSSESEGWIAQNVPALLGALDAHEAARVRIAQLSVSANAVLRVLCFGPVAGAEVVGAAVALDPLAVEADLAVLEVRGYVRRLGDGSWTTAHDEISDLVMAQSDAVSLDAARRAIALARAASPTVSVADMRQVVSLLMRSGADGEVVDVVRAWVRGGACPSVGVHASDLLPPGLHEARAAPLRATIARILPKAHRGRRWQGLVAAMLLGAIALGWYLTRPAALVLVQAPIAANAVEVTDRPAIIGVADRLGRRLRVSGVLVRVRSSADPPPSGELSVLTREGTAKFDSLIVGGLPGEPSVLRFEATGLAPVEWRHVWMSVPMLRLRSGMINGQAMAGTAPVLHVAPGESIDGRVLLTYRSTWTTASVVLGEAASWERRETDTVTVRSLVTPLDPGVVTVNVHRVAPATPGRYFLIWSMGAEARAAYLFAQSNWSCGAPIWHDGNDVQDQPPDALRAAAATGTLVLPMTKCVQDRAPSAPWRVMTPTGLAVVEVVVGANR